jgi:type VI protein secretion system component Hcp
VQIDDLVLTMLYDRAAPVMQAYCLKGKSIPKLEVELTLEEGGSDAVYLRYELQNVTIASYQTSAEAGDDMPAAVILSCRFGEMKVVYTEFAPDGSKSGTVECKYKSKKS